MAMHLEDTDSQNKEKHKYACIRFTSNWGAWYCYRLSVAVLG